MSYSTPPNKPSIPVEPFEISIPEKDITELKELIKLSRIPKETYENTHAEPRDGFGVSRDWLIKTKDEWLKFDWSAQETRLNAQPNFIAKVKNSDDIEYSVHFSALFSEKKDAIPIILSHGWPGCYLEFLPIFELVRKKYSPADLPFHLITPSLPGYLFSQQPAKDREFNVKDIAYLFNGLMEGLGFGDRYIAQGGDIGSSISYELAASFPACKAIHLNFRRSLISHPEVLKLQGKSEYTLQDQIAELQKFGYALEHATKPSTIGLVLGTNPLSLLTWIGEKYLGWSDQDLSTETILTFTSLYWFTDSYNSTIYTYRYNLGSKRGGPSAEDKYQDKPVGFSFFPNELAPSPPKWVEKVANVVWSREHKSGGHFAALEKPAELWQDVEEFVGQVWK
ncbi:hypothetical protein CI109_105441 [Kwoniella shandongensis]|uniref:Uncharacterized protein n=1 Tax=Kwoniella shandongensis TaxID=1734106 RepID=A0A5M6C669_9TREE|nr:uncharacterized protein CI109_002162 [Kwoniella shandongensis]KAA5529272.1 hypothetical protein CI109_002162 [Kwoniella shandongensis]